MKKVALAYSGGLDTSFCLVHLKRQGYHVSTITIDTGGFSDVELAGIADRARSLGSERHVNLDAKSELYRRFGTYIVKGNILKGGVYPLCVGVERGIQAEKLAEFASEIQAEAVCHGCTGAGNDQVRFDVSIRSVNPALKIIAPIRELALSREAELKQLADWGVEFPAKSKKYSINQGILGTTIGGGETHDAWASIPEEAFVGTKNPDSAPADGEEIVIGFESGDPASVNGKTGEPHEILMELNVRAGMHGVGRGVHLGDTVLGIKGRIAFEAPGAVTLITAHRELEKLVLTKWQQIVKNQLSEMYGMLLHEGQYFNPVMRDVEAFFDSGQQIVTGEARVRLKRGQVSVEGVRSDASMIDARATYGEGAKMWTGRDAEASAWLVEFSRCWLCRRRRGSMALAKSVQSLVVSDTQRAIDMRMVPFDLWATTAHVLMLIRQGIVSVEAGRKILSALSDIEKSYEEGTF